MRRKYDYRGRYLPHLQKDNRALFVTFATQRRWHLPDLARDLALEACIHAHGRKCTLHAAVIMPDHVHLILTLLSDDHGPITISQVMQTIKSESAHRINKALDRRGKVWQNESFDHVLRNDEYLASKVTYVLENPVRAGLVPNPTDYRWLWQDPWLLLQTA